MKFLNKVILSFIFFYIGYTNCYANTNKYIQEKKIEKTVIIFGYPFRAYSNFGQYNYFEFNNSEFQTQIKTIKVKNKEIAQVFSTERLSLFKSVFEVRRVDYPGQYSKSIECPEEFKPKYFEREIPDGYLSYFIGYANTNKVAGACSQDLVAFRHFYGIVYCKYLNQLLEIEHFADVSQKSLNYFIDCISCKDLVIEGVQ